MSRRKSPIRYVAALRTYAWDEGIAELASRFFAAVPSARQVVLVDETKGPIPIPGYEKISHSDDTACFGLPNHPKGKSLYFNGDYALYFLQRELPDFDYYLMSEYDLAVNITLEPMMRFVIDQRIDLLAHEINPSGPDWYWHSHATAISAAPWRSLLNLMVLSRRAITCLLKIRRQIARRFAAGEIAVWPLDEAFVPTVLKSTRGMRIADISRFADTKNFAFRPWLSLHDPRANRPGSLAHSVLGSKRFIAALLGKNPPRDFFREGSELREGLIGLAPFEDIVEPLRRALARNHDLAGVALLHEEAVAKGWPVDRTTDLAFCKPATASSVSPWSRHRDPEGDACGANDDSLFPDYAFHTHAEVNPWWMVDLLDESLVEEVAIVNRLNQAGRFTTFRIESSSDGGTWTTQFTQAKPAEVSSDPKSPWRMRFPDPFLARYVRILLLGVGPLHLRRVQVFGRFMPAPLRPARRRSIKADRSPIVPTIDLAFCKPALSSSVSPWSRHQDPEDDACGANDGSLPSDYAFHTCAELNPWWMVDLLGESLIEEIAIVNRFTEAARFRTFCIESSSDGSIWTTRLTQAKPGEVSSNPKSPWRMRFPHPFPARYVRIILLGNWPLHLRRVQVFGRTLPAQWQPARPRSAESQDRWPLGPTTDLAFCKPAAASSKSPWSRYEAFDPHKGDANGERVPHDCGFHTSAESNPWWMVDLLDESRVEEIAIVNRFVQAERFRTFRIESSSDGSAWTTRFTQTEPAEVSSDPRSPWRMRFPFPFLARYLRIVLLHFGPLHLRRVQVFGRCTLPPRSQAARLRSQPA